MKQIINFIRAVFAASLLVLMVSSTFTWAHQPLWNSGSSTPLTPYVIEDIKVSKAIFGELTDNNLAYFLLSVPDKFKLDVGIFRGNGCEDSFLPELWFLREGQTSDMPFDSLVNFEASRVEGQWSSYRGHGLTGFKGAKLNEQLSAGTYMIVVYAPQGEGLYLLSLGGLEQFGGSQEGRAAIPKFNACG